MKTIFFRLLFCGLLLYGNTFSCVAQVCDNLALAFDGNDDYLTLTPLPASFTTNPVFTVEAWFYANTPGGGNCVNAIPRLLSFSGGSTPATFSVLDIGLCNGGLLHYKYNWGTGGLFIASQISSVVVANACHHIAVTYSANTMQVYLDGVLVNTITIPSNVAFEFNTFQVGHSIAGGAGQDWDGLVDEVRLWNTVRSATDIDDFKDCTLSGAGPNLLAYWTFDQAGATANGNNSTIPNASDMTGNGNHGVFSTGPNGFALNGTTSNFVCNNCSSPYIIDISSIPDPLPVSYIRICSGDAVHFCITENFIPVGNIPGATVVWEYLDAGILPWQPVPNSNGIFTGYCFFVPPGELDVSAECANSTTGFVDRKYRARITTTNQTTGQSCTFTTTESTLEICCPLTNATVQAVVQAPLPFNGVLCDDPAIPVTIDVSITGLTFFNNLTIQWCLNGQPITGVGSVTSFTYTGPAVAPQMCFEAKIQNCACPPANPSFCIPVDPKPMCGTIDGMDPVDLFPTGVPYEYEICPGHDALVGMVNPADFKNCNPLWQFHLDTDGPGVWKDLGFSNSNQNTNTLAQLYPANSPYLWLPTTTCISYRIQCRPLNFPNSGCDTCLSNEVKICLVPPPVNVTISGNTQFCENTGTTLTVNPTGPYTYTWYLNGVGPVGSGTSYFATQGGCYTVEVSNACEKVVSPPYCVEECIIVPEIDCPLDNPCACPGVPITLSGCDSADTCTGTMPFTYAWSASTPPPGIPGGPNGCEYTHTPAPGGTTYTLTVTNSIGCSASVSRTIIPCQ